MYAKLIKLCRRGSAFGLYGVVVYRLVSGQWPLHDLSGVEFGLPGMSTREVAIILAIGWYGFLSQLKVGWFLWLPFYLVLFPPGFVAAKLGRFALKPLVSTVSKAAEATERSGLKKTQRRQVPWKRLWMLLLLAWLIGLRAIQRPWVAWVPPLLLLPIWVWSLRLAYSRATTPVSLAAKTLAFCQSLVEGIEKQKQQPPSSGQKGADKINRLVIGIIRWLLNRYSTDKVNTAVHREAFLLFSATSALTFVMSSVFWGSLGSAVVRASPSCFSGYHFFSDGRLAEFWLWAFGCMTTSIGFPGQESSVGVKSLHATILATGIFQITYLLACFSIMASAAGAEFAKTAATTVNELGPRLDGLVVATREESSVIEAKLVDETPADQPPGSSG